jgi:hypothetical protein
MVPDKRNHPDDGGNRCATTKPCVTSLCRASCHHPDPRRDHVATRSANAGSDGNRDRAAGGSDTTADRRAHRDPAASALSDRRQDRTEPTRDVPSTSDPQRGGVDPRHPLAPGWTRDPVRAGPASPRPDHRLARRNERGASPRANAVDAERSIGVSGSDPPITRATTKPQRLTTVVARYAPRQVVPLVWKHLATARKRMSIRRGTHGRSRCRPRPGADTKNEPFRQFEALLGVSASHGAMGGGRCASMPDPSRSGRRFRS